MLHPVQKRYLHIPFPVLGNCKSFSTSVLLDIDWQCSKSFLLSYVREAIHLKIASQYDVTMSQPET